MELGHDAVHRAQDRRAGGRPPPVGARHGCGEGRTIEQLARYGHELSGFDFPDKADALRARLGPLLGADFKARVRLMEDERRIPFEDQRFDVVYSNQVFEHIRFLDQMLAECTRVLRPDGALVTLFPLATYPLEGHVLVPSPTGFRQAGGGAGTCGRPSRSGLGAACPVCQ